EAWRRKSSCGEREKARILGDAALSVKPLLRQKKSATQRVALNPPKEEGGGDKNRWATPSAHQQNQYKREYAALQCRRCETLRSLAHVDHISVKVMFINIFV
ncbi:MAG: hypothetical protein OEX78_16930, partial [Betaproteobacteria bacterium]|nr:hypothetical protein [Betaproteobacteria bacterium]